MSGSLPPLPPVDARVYPILAEAGLGPDLFNPRQHECCALVEAYVLHLVVELATTLDLPGMLTRPRTVMQLLDEGGFVEAFRTPLGWLLDRLAVDGLVAATRDSAGGTYHLATPLPVVDPDGVRAAGLAADASYAPVYTLLDETARAYAGVARGETTGERALMQRIALWCAYFSNDNAYYALNNHVTARAAAARLPPEGGRVLEVGAGLGSATEALLTAHGGRPLGSYAVTEPVSFFRRRAERALGAAHPTAPFAFSALDVNEPWAPQGVEPGSCDLVWGVNVFHLAHRLDDVVAEAHAALASGGWLVIGEGLRPSDGRPVGAEFPFQLLESFVGVETDPDTRPTPGFLTGDVWSRALARVGFAWVEVVPDAARLQTIYPGLVTGAICGRRA